MIYFGRIDDSQKNVSLINRINHNINLIDFYGKGNEEIIKELGKNYKGFLNQDKDSNNLIKKYKYMILMSNCEGFGFSLVESLAAGVPIIVKDSFLDARYLVNNNNNGFLLKNNQSIDEYAKQINEIYNLDSDAYRQLCRNSYNFACKNLSEKTFNEK
ncbi:glycosyltransferase [bacterium]|nr:glycosyltransferase [bacterium]